MIEINDLEEKKHIIAYYKCNSGRNCKNIFNNNSIYNDWWRWWGMDFPKKRNGKPMQIYKNQLVISAAKHRKGITTNMHKECTAILSSVTNWINKNYNKQITRKENRKKFREMLIRLRKNNYNNLLQILNDAGLVDKGYSIQDTSSENIYELRNYCLIYSGDTVTVKNGSYETILEHLHKIMDNDITIIEGMKNE